MIWLAGIFVAACGLWLIGLAAAIVVVPARAERFLLGFANSARADGGFVAECLTEAIFTQAENRDEPRSNVRGAVAAFFAHQDRPGSIRLHLVRDEVLATG